MARFVRDCRTPKRGPCFTPKMAVGKKSFRTEVILLAAGFLLFFVGLLLSGSGAAAGISGLALMVMSLVLIVVKAASKGHATAEVPGPQWTPPPNWPRPPVGWVPPSGWQPDPVWGPAPDGWQFWQTAVTPDGGQPQVGGYPASPAPGSWISRNKAATGVVAVAALLFAALAASPDGDPPQRSADDRQATATQTSLATPAPNAGTARSTVPEPPVAPAGPVTEASGELSDGGISVLEARIVNELGDFEVTLRVRNTNDRKLSAYLDLTILKGGRLVATAKGLALDMEAGEVVTEDMTSTDEFVEGPYELEFRVQETDATAER